MGTVLQGIVHEEIRIRGAVLRGNAPKDLSLWRRSLLSLSGIDHTRQQVGPIPENGPKSKTSSR